MVGELIIATVSCAIMISSWFIIRAHRRHIAFLEYGADYFTVLDEINDNCLWLFRRKHRSLKSMSYVPSFSGQLKISQYYFSDEFSTKIMNGEDASSLFTWKQLYFLGLRKSPATPYYKGRISFLYKRKRHKEIFRVATDKGWPTSHQFSKEALSDILRRHELRKNGSNNGRPFS